MTLKYIFKNKRGWFQVTWQGSAIFFIAVIIGLSVNQFRSDKLPLVADWSSEAQLTADSGEGVMISLGKAEEAFFSQAAVFLDSRSQEIYELGHIKGARNLPWENSEERFSEVMADISPETLIIAYCDGEGCNWSKDLALLLLENGYENVRVLVNGWTLWQEAHLPIEEGALEP